MAGLTARTTRDRELGAIISAPSIPFPSATLNACIVLRVPTPSLTAGLLSVAVFRACLTVAFVMVRPLGFRGLMKVRPAADAKMDRW